MGRAGIAYANKDYESIRKALLAKIPQLTDRLTDFNHSGLGMVLLQLFCGLGEMPAYFMAGTDALDIATIIFGDG